MARSRWRGEAVGAGADGLALNRGDVVEAGELLLPGDAWCGGDEALEALDFAGDLPRFPWAAADLGLALGGEQFLGGFVATAVDAFVGHGMRWFSRLGTAVRT